MHKHNMMCQLALIALVTQLCEECPAPQLHLKNGRSRTGVTAWNKKRYIMKWLPGGEKPVTIKTTRMGLNYRGNALQEGIFEAEI